MTTPALNIQGIDVFIDGQGPQTVVMIHGWPDTHRLWDNTVDALKDRYRCVRFTLPGFDRDKGARATSLADMAALFSTIVDAASPNDAVTLLLHDWGCIFGYEYAAMHPERVARIVGVDIGDHNSSAFHRSLDSKAKRMIFGYQVWLALAWKLGSVSAALGTAMTRWMARAMKCPTAPDHVGWFMNYPYAMQWFGLKGGFRGAKRVDSGVCLACPLLFIYGKRKPFMFHSKKWADEIAARPHSAVQGLPTGHWVMVQEPQAFNGAVRTWLDKTSKP